MFRGDSVIHSTKSSKSQHLFFLCPFKYVWTDAADQIDAESNSDIRVTDKENIL
jgi:hypothetical protein